MTMARLGGITCIVFYSAIIINAQHNDDIDYDDVDFYEDLPMDYSQKFAKEHTSVVQDDFYILTDFEDKETHNDHYVDSNDVTIKITNNGAPLQTQKSFWDNMPEKVYRYTKHRIAGYDYDELDYLGPNGNRICDEKSVWTHCLCQFTCTEPDIVDCYTPCKSGCECKEDYVFDEKTRQCILPENCSKEDYFIYDER